MKAQCIATTALLCLALPFQLAAQASPGEGRAAPALAVLDIANAGQDPRLDYLGSIIQGLLAFDLGRGEGIALVDRRNLDAVLKETELSLSGMAQDPGEAAKAGRLVGADWLLSGEYVFLGSDVLLSLSLTETATAKRQVFRDRGPDENLVHRLAEQIAHRLSGKDYAFAEPGKSRSLVSLRDESPGSVALFSPIIRAEVYLDGDFVGYTTGDGTLPLVLDKLSPGEHRLRVHLDNSFGAVKLPEVSFGDWEAAVKVEPGKRATVRDQTRQFNDTLYHLIELGEGELRADAKAVAGGSEAELAKLAFEKDLSFQDRSGAEIAIHLSAVPRRAPIGVAVDLKLKVGKKGEAGVESSLTIEQGEEGEKEGEAEAGIVKLSSSLGLGWDRWTLEWRVERSDIHQDMFRE